MENLELSIYRLTEESNIKDIIATIMEKMEGKFQYRHFEKIVTVNNKKYNTNFSFFINENSFATIDWYTEISSLFNEREIMNKKVYSGYGILLIYCNEFKYAIMFGRATYLLNKYTDWNFGLEMAAKMLNKSSINAQSSKFFSTSKNKSLVEYFKGKFNPEAGESIDMLTANISEIPGKSCINNICNYINPRVGFSSGIKAVMHMENISIKDVVNVIIWLNRIYNEYSYRFNIPKLLFLKSNDVLIEQLNTKLNNDILQNDNINVSIGFYSIIDSEFVILNGISSYKLSFNRKTREYNILTIEDIKQFMIENKLKDVSQINLKINFENSSKNINVLKIIDYTTEIEGQDRFFCLYDGKWASFNIDYINTVKEKVKEINKEIVVFDSSYNLSYKELDQIRDTDKEEISKLLNIPVEELTDSDMYREYVYNYKIAKEKGALLLDRKKHNYVEICDIYSNNELIHTKIGSPGAFNECINQSIYGFEMWNNNQASVNQELQINGVDTVTLLLITDNQQVLREKDINKFKSVRFKLNLIDWKAQVESYGKNAKIIIGKLEQ